MGKSLLYGRRTEIRLAPSNGNETKVCEVEKGVLHKQKLDTETMGGKTADRIFLGP